MAPALYEVPRPCVGVLIYALGSASEPLYTQGLVDSGADGALFHAPIAEWLGLDVRAGHHHFTTGVGGGRLECWRHEVELSVFDKRFHAAVDFAYGWRAEYGLLGLRDLFAQFHVGIDVPGQRVLMSPIT